MRDRKGVDLEVRGAGEELGREKVEETVIGAWCINELFILIKGDKMQKEKINT